MGEYIIRGGIRLNGEVEISGAKNAVLPVLAASVVTGDESVFLRCPEITDVESMLKILQSLGCRVKRDDDTISVDSSFLSEYRIPEDLMKEMAAGSLACAPFDAVKIICDNILGPEKTQ